MALALHVAPVGQPKAGAKVGPLSGHEEQNEEDRHVVSARLEVGQVHREIDLCGGVMGGEGEELRLGEIVVC